MKPIIKICSTVLDRLSKVKQPGIGKLYGLIVKQTVTVVGLELSIENGINLNNSLPAEMDFCGVFQIGDGSIDSRTLREYVDNVDVTDNPVFISSIINDPNKIKVYLITNDQIEENEYETLTEHDIYSQFVLLRVKGQLPVKCEVNPKSIELEFSNLRKLVTSGAIAFCIGKSNVYLCGNENVVGTGPEETLNDLLEQFNEDSENKSKKKKILNLEVHNVNVLRKVSREITMNPSDHAPLCILDKKKFVTFDALEAIDSLAMVNRQAAVSYLYNVFVESIIRHLRLYEEALLSNLNDNGESNISEPQTFHFFSNECGHFVTKVYPKNYSEEALYSQRELLHSQLLLNSQTPVFRRANSYVYEKNNGPLINPHEGLKPTGNGGQVALVRGRYEYYHYCQNRMDDNGWGCAYRSLQTLASWFKIQGYVNKSVPSFQDIQKCLVDIGDKPRSFINSRQWIGSTEVGFVLETLLGVNIKILHVSSGEEMSNKGPELINHFENHGSPIMIGGGVLAHTILGVDYNRDTGNIKFLILDPHYTGGEDLQVIQNKGWCGWKGVDFWDKKAYYNMCLPQVPKGI